MRSHKASCSGHRLRRRLPELSFEFAEIAVRPGEDRPVASITDQIAVIGV